LAICFSAPRITVAQGPATDQHTAKTTSNLPPSNYEEETPCSGQSEGIVGSVFDYVGMTVNDIQFRCVPSSDVPGLRQFLKQGAGEPLDRYQVRNSVRALFSTDRFAQIQVEAQPAPGGKINLVFILSPNYFVNLVTVTGVPDDMSSSQVVNASKLQLGELFTKEKLEDGLQRIRQLLQDNGYFGATVTESDEKDSKTQTINVNFGITVGPRAHVGNVTVRGNPMYPLPKLFAIAHLRSGESVKGQLISNALQRLRKRYQKKGYLEAQVSIPVQQYDPSTNRVNYTLNINPGPIVDIRVQGASFSKSVLKRNIPVYEENAVDEDLLNEGRRNLRNYAQTQGYFEAEVNVKRVFEQSGNRLHIIYVVEKGDKHKLTNIYISGNKYFTREIIRERMQIQPAGRLLSQGLYSQSLLTRDEDTLGDLYRANGFAQVKINSSVRDDFGGEKGRIAVFLNVEEGPQTLVAALHVIGNTAIPESQLRGLITNTEGQPYSNSNVALDRDALLNEYFNFGFPNAQFDYATKPAGEPNRVDVTYTLHEGEQFFVNQVMVSGLNYTRPFVVQRELLVHSGDPISQTQMLDSQRQLYDLGIFNEVDTAVQNPDGNVRNKNVIFRLQEAKRYTFNYGFGFEAQTGQPAGSTQPQGETGVSPRVSFDLTRLNFRGRNHTISFKSHVGRLQQRGLINYDAPRWLSNPNLRLTLAAFYDNTLDVLTFTSQRLEGSVQLEQTLSKATTFLYRFNYRRVRASNLVITSNQIPLLSQPVRVGMPTFTYIRDRRDNPIETTRGNYSTVDLGVAGGFFGSEANFSRVLTQNSTYHPLKKKWVFARSTRVGVENLFGSSTFIPLPEEFLAGGGNSHRGFAINQAGPRDPNTGAPLGGDAVFVNNLEMRTPPVDLPYVGNAFSFVFFHDIGNVFKTPHDMLSGLTRFNQDRSNCNILSTLCDFSYMSQAIGAGIRYKTPIGPIRMDFGYNLNPPVFPVLQGDNLNPAPHVETGRHFNFFFSIGQTF